MSLQILVNQLINLAGTYTVPDVSLHSLYSCVAYYSAHDYDCDHQISRYIIIERLGGSTCPVAPVVAPCAVPSHADSGTPAAWQKAEDSLKLICSLFVHVWLG